jgi:tetratricopeptide (TPR) repeat protein
MRHVTALLAVALFASGCANQINLHTAANYAKACYAYQSQNEWWKARMSCGRAATNADLGNASPRARAVMWYEYGRTSGVICDYVEARRGLNTALKLDEESSGPTYMTLMELGRLELDQGNWKDAMAHFARFDATVPRDTAEKKDPIGYADALDEYARAADGAGDSSLASSLRQRSRHLRGTNTGKSSNTDRTPYGKYCGQKS